MKQLIKTVIGIALSQQVFAQQDSTVKRFSITPLPIIISDPFIGLGYGALANASLMIGDAKSTRYSNAQVYVINTTNGQFAAQVNHMLFTNHENWIIQGKLQYLNWPEKVYSIGARSPQKSEELISYKAIELEERMMKHMGNHNFIGIQYRLYDCYDVHSNKPDVESNFKQHAVGSAAFTASSLGIHYMYDSRDHAQNAYSGAYIEVAVNPYSKWLKSTQNWINTRLDIRKYIPFRKRKKNTDVLAFRGVYEQAAGDIPYMLMPMFGRYNTTRGYVQGRYRGTTFVSSEAEYRAHIWKAFGGVVFAGAHTVTEQNGQFKYVNPSVGTGVRIMLNASQRTNLRVDYAKGLQGQGGLYLQVTEVF